MVKFAIFLIMIIKCRFIVLNLYYSFTYLDLQDKSERPGYCFGVLIVLSYVLAIITFPLSLCFCLKVRTFTHNN